MKNNTNNTVVTGIPESLIESQNVPHPCDHPDLFRQTGENEYEYTGPDDFVETVKVIQVTDGTLIAADPCYANREYERLCVYVDNVRNGQWAVDYAGVNLRAINNDYKMMLFKTGERNFIEWDYIIDGLVYADTGLAGFFTDPDADLDEESDGFEYRFTFRGDGGYPVLVKEINGEVVALEIVYEGGSIFNYTHGVVSEEDQLAAIEAVENSDWETYQELAEKYNLICDDYACFSPVMFLGYGVLPLDEESFMLADHCEWENG